MAGVFGSWRMLQLVVSGNVWRQVRSMRLDLFDARDNFNNKMGEIAS